MAMAVRAVAVHAHGEHRRHGIKLTLQRCRQDRRRHVVLDARLEQRAHAGVKGAQVCFELPAHA
jgi:hypothetical protein